MNLDAFKKKLRKRVSKKIAVIVFGILAALMLLLAIVVTVTAKTDVVVFDGLDTTKNVRMDVVYLMGPFAGNDEKDLYLAEDTDGNWLVFATKVNTDLPVFGDDVDEDDIDALEPVTLYGKTEEMDSDVVEYLVDFLNDNEITDVTENNYMNYFGDAYFEDAGSLFVLKESLVFWILFVVLGILAVVFFSAERKSRKEIDQCINQYETDGSLEQVYQDYISTQYPIEEKKLPFFVTNHYIVSFTGNHFSIIPLTGITNIYKSRVNQGQVGWVMSIVLEKGDEEITIPTMLQYSTKNEKAAEELVGRIAYFLKQNQEVTENVH